MSIEWFTKRPGQDMGVGLSEDDLGDGGIISIMPLGDKPDFVKVPAETGFPGIRQCLEVKPGRCPLPGHDHSCAHFVLEGPVSCAECVQGGFVWYKLADSMKKAVSS